MARGRRPRLRLGLMNTLAGVAIALQVDLPVVPVAYLHTIKGQDQVTTGDTVGWPQLTQTVAAQNAALRRAGQPPTSIFAGTTAKRARWTSWAAATTCRGALWPQHVLAVGPGAGSDAGCPS